uniref:VWFA domain-containing protein n=1 Tax=Oncorhynchus kisutch TaxID=8019 RepID=A0A8C7CZA0_ONCKI
NLERQTLVTAASLIPKFSDIFFLVDSNMMQADFQLVRTLLMRLVNQLNPSTKTMRLGLAQFAQDTKVEFLLNTHNTKEEYLAAVRKFRLPLRPNRSRHLGDALEYARAHFFTTASGGRNEQGYRQFLVTVTGGDSKDNVMKVARTIKSEGTTIVSIGLGESTLPELKLMATSPFFYQTTSITSALKTVFETEEVVTVTDGKASLADIVFIVDESSSNRTANFQLVRGFIHKIVDGLDIDFNRVRVGIVLYSNKASAQVYLNSFQEKTNILQFIKILPYRRGLTYTGEALEYAREKMFIKERGSRKEQGVQQVAIVITGKSQDNITSHAAALRRAGVTVYAVGIKDADENELRQIASDPPNKHVLHVDSFAKLKTLEKSLKKNDTSAFFSLLILGCLQTDEADMFFLIDHSGSIEYPDFADMKTFINKFINTFHIGPHHVRVGVVKFSDTPALEFDLTTYPDKPSVEKAVDGIIQLGGGTKTGLALNSMGPHFDRAKATRSNKVREYLIVITDGESEDNVKDQAAKLRAQGITIYAIGVKLANDTQLLEIAGIRGDVLFLIDSSGSINNPDFQKMKVFMQSIINKSDIGLDKVHVGIIQFSTSQQVIFPLNKHNDKEGMLQDLQTMQQIGGGTHTGKALSYTSQFFDPPKGGRTNVKQFLIVVTDGEAQDEVMSPAKKLQDKGVIIYAIGVVNANNTQLLEISGAQERVYSERDFDALKALDSQLALAICDPERECVRTEIADIIFLVDGSTSISSDNFDIMKNFMKSVVNETSVGEKQTRYGLIVFSDNPESKFTLNEYKSKRDVNSAITKLREPSGDTYTGKALKYSLGYFGAQYGGRKALNVPQWLMVITDGEATDPYSLAGPAKELRDNGIIVYSIGVVGANKQELELMAGDTNKVFFVDDFHKLDTLHKNISFEFCQTSKPVCEKTQGDLVLLIDSSGSISTTDFTIMKKFATDLVSSFNIAEQSFRVGVAQFSSDPKKEFFLNEYYTEAEVNNQINNMMQIRYTTNIGKALDYVRTEYFQPARGSRINAKVSQNLVVITDGRSDDDVVDAAEKLKAMNIEVFAIGIGKDHKPVELGQITLNPERVFSVQDFASLDKIKKKVVDTICSSKVPDTQAGCTIDIAMGFDITRRATAQGLFDGQAQLQAFLPQIIRYVSNLKGLCCVAGDGSIETNIGFRVVEQDGKVLYDYNFEKYDEKIVEKVMALQTSQTTYFNSFLLRSFSDKFQKSNAGVKVLVIFSDGLDDDVMKLEQESELLRKGINALLTVALEGVQNANLLQMVEFGRGFGYKQPLNIGMHNLGNTLLTQIVSGSSFCDNRIRTALLVVSPCVVVILYAACPAYPTEMVFALDMSQDVEPATFERMRSALLSILDDVAIAESNCPTGARVAVVSYSANTKYLIRFQDYQRKPELLEAIQNIALERTSNQRHLGEAMRFVGRHVFKRTRKALTMRKVAVFFTNGPSVDSAAIVTAAMEFKALNIAPAVIAMKNSPDVQRAFEADDTGSFILVRLVDRSQDQNAVLTRIKNCVICYDHCKPAQGCDFTDAQRPLVVDMDLTLVVDGSREIRADQYAGVQELLGSVVKQVAWSPKPSVADGRARVALLQTSGSLLPQTSQAVKVEFDLQKYHNHIGLQTHLRSMQQQGGVSSLGQTLEHALSKVFLKATRPRKSRVVLAVVGAETAHWDQAKLAYISQKAKCQGVSLFVIAVGDHYNSTQVEELASTPSEQHLLHLWDLLPRQCYCGGNSYPPAHLKLKCELMLGQEHGQGQGQAEWDVWKEEEEYTDEEEFLEHTGVFPTQIALDQVETIDAFSRGDGATSPPRPQPNSNGNQ